MTSPTYALGRIVAAARAGRVVFAGRRLQIDIAQLGYTLDDVHECLATLRPEDHRGVFEADGVLFDVYLPGFHGPHGGIDELYVKLTERSEATLPQVVLASFHLQRKG